jgi:hypothetical protein
MQMTRVALWGMRLLGVLAALYVGGFSAANIHDAWNVTSCVTVPPAHCPAYLLGQTFTNWPDIIFLIGGIGLAALFFYVVLGSSTLRLTLARLVIGVVGLYAYLLVGPLGR